MNAKLNTHKEPGVSLPSASEALGAGILLAAHADYRNFDDQHFSVGESNTNTGRANRAIVEL